MTSTPVPVQPPRSVYGLSIEAYQAVRAAVAEELANNGRSRVVSFARAGADGGGLSGAVSSQPSARQADPQGTILVNLFLIMVLPELPKSKHGQECD